MARKSAELTRPGGELTRPGEGSVEKYYLCDLCIVGFGILSMDYGGPPKHDFECSLNDYKL
ncbi:hypothetical protein HanRHA438_Chr15g0703561 [Helianthus annuus]|nr:hypothetical protein HanHA300_Chr15g0563151 [Helianthus annuus]KAJ0472909.1 hypothetical protein HanHA89_Chr15g0612371 [Helianthus annuus]KAJ0648516.1 hypothetical protein HanLR1_Chr15g0573791 [Helianthus annuus]KAJ0652341.1 hypothetical protein HanOQP8_Chr15g0571081 [Helianthus annuus]KAJ0844536.1 hypothetical protein HanRHA438_Chr15g0703561 [Helianthus annuus]